MLWAFAFPGPWPGLVESALQAAMLTRANPLQVGRALPVIPEMSSEMDVAIEPKQVNERLAIRVGPPVGPLASWPVTLH